MPVHIPAIKNNFRIVPFMLRIAFSFYGTKIAGLFVTFPKKITETEKEAAEVEKRRLSVLL
jgi:hypothetical protein